MFFWKNKDVKLQIGDVQNAIKESRDIRELDKDFSHAISKLREDFSSLNESIDALNSKTSDNKYSNIVKNKFCTRGKEILDGIEYPKSITSAGNFHDTMKEKLSELSSLNIKEFRHLSAFKEEMKAVAENIKSAENSTASIGKILNYPVSKNVIELVKSLAEIKKLELVITETEEQIKGINENIARTEELIKAKRKGLQNALQSSDYMRAEMMRKEIEKMRRDARTIETKISEEFASIERIFRKFSHSNAYEKELVDKYIDDGFAAFLDDEEGKIKIILDKMRIAVETGKIEEDRKYQKLLDIIRSLSLFESLRRQYKEIKSQQVEMANEVPAVEKDIELLKREIESAEHTVTKMQRDLELKNKSIGTAMQELEGLKGELTNSVSGILGKKVILV